MSIVEMIKDKAKMLNKKIVLVEGEDSRVVEAASVCVKEGIAQIVLLGNQEEIAKANPTIDLTGVEVIDPATSPLREKYASILLDLRKSKGMTEEEATKLSYDNTYFGVLMLKAGDADGLVSGACHSTANTLRPGLQIVKTAPNTPLVSSYFIMVAPAQGNIYCPDGAFIYSDCGLEQNPDVEKLAQIAKQASKSAEEVLGFDPRVAFLSHSSKGSAKHADVTKVVDAVARFHEIAPNVKADGEFQLDCAIVPEVAKSKAPGSTVAGNANVLVFPDLDAGNIGYKLTERLGGFQAIGPLCQGFAKPINDLSRGCHMEDVVCAVAVTAVQSKIDWSK